MGARRRLSALSALTVAATRGLDEVRCDDTDRASNQRAERDTPIVRADDLRRLYQGDIGGTRSPSGQGAFGPGLSFSGEPSPRLRRQMSA